MAYLDKKTAIFQRNEQGELIPEDVVLENYDNKTKVRIIPMTRGKIKEIFGNLNSEGDTTKDQDSEIILNNCIEPSFTKEDIEYLKPQLASAIVYAILAESLGMEQKELLNQSVSKAIELQEDNLKK